MYCPRGCNRLAHQLAQLGASLESSDNVCVWLDDFPGLVSDIVTSDCAGLVV